MTIQFRLIGLLFLLAFFPATASAEKRVALLIGNAAYAAVPQLKNPPNDVALMKAAFEGAGFDKVTTAADVGRQGMVTLLRAFEDQASDADIVVIYYSGHGLEMNGENYLVPVDAQLVSDRDVADETVTLARLMQATEGARQLRLVILDACRNNPFLARIAAHGKTRAISRGLARPAEQMTADTLVAFAAKEGTEALDGDGANSPFAQALAKRLVAPGAEIEFALRQVRDDVLAATGNRQEPFKYGSLGGVPIALVKAEALPPLQPAVQAAPPPAAANACADASAHWTVTQKFDKLEFYQEHLRLFPACPFASFAKARIDELTKVAVVAPPPPEPPPGTSDCDRLAGTPDPGNPSTGVAADAIDAPRAIEACRSAFAKYPTAIRFGVQLARALVKAKQYEEAVKLNRDAADKGDPVALNNLAAAYGNGLGVPKDNAQAVDFYRRAADKGYAVAQFNLASFYERGVGLKKDDGEAARLYRQAAEGGFGLALANLGVFYEFGRGGLPKDIAKAAQLYQQAADKGVTGAMLKLGYLYATGAGVAKDGPRALQLFTAARDKGDKTAFLNLGTMYLLGTGVGKDPKLAVRYFREGMEKGDAGAMFSLANMYMIGLGVPKDEAQAASLWIESISSGNELAYFNLVDKAASYTPTFRRQIQSALAGKGLYFGNVDGRFNEQTVAALKQLAGK